MCGEVDMQFAAPPAESFQTPLKDGATVAGDAASSVERELLPDHSYSHLRCVQKLQQVHTTIWEVLTTPSPTRARRGPSKSNDPENEPGIILLTPGTHLAPRPPAGSPPRSGRTPDKWEGDGGVPTGNLDRDDSTAPSTTARRPRRSGRSSSHTRYLTTAALKKEERRRERQMERERHRETLAEQTADCVHNLKNKVADAPSPSTSPQNENRPANGGLVASPSASADHDRCLLRADALRMEAAESKKQVDMCLARCAARRELQNRRGGPVRARPPSSTSNIDSVRTPPPGAYSHVRCVQHLNGLRTQPEDENQTVGVDEAVSIEAMWVAGKLLPHPCIALHFRDARLPDGQLRCLEVRLPVVSRPEGAALKLFVSEYCEYVCSRLSEEAAPFRNVAIAQLRRVITALAVKMFSRGDPL